MGLTWHPMTGTTTIRAEAGNRRFFIHPVHGTFDLTSVVLPTAEVLQLGSFATPDTAKAHAETSLANMRKFVAQARGGA
jgi:hypothetical protein